MRDNLGRFWKVDKKDGSFICYTKKSDGIKELTRTAPMPDLRVTHNKCGGTLFGLVSTSVSDSWKLCSKCASEVKERRATYHFASHRE